MEDREDASGRVVRRAHREQWSKVIHEGKPTDALRTKLKLKGYDPDCFDSGPPSPKSLVLGGPPHLVLRGYSQPLPDGPRDILRVRVSGGARHAGRCSSSFEEPSCLGLEARRLPDKATLRWTERMAEQAGGAPEVRGDSRTLWRGREKEEGSWPTKHLCQLAELPLRRLLKARQPCGDQGFGQVQTVREISGGDTVLVDGPSQHRWRDLYG